MSPTAAAKPARFDERIRFGLRFKILLGLTLLNVVGTAVFAWSHYRTERTNIIEGVEQKLAAAARALPDMLPDGYLDRAVRADAVSAAEYERILHRLSAYCRDTGLLYIYTYANVDGRFRTTSSNGTAEEIAEGTYAKYWEEYKVPLLQAAWSSGQPQYDETNDDDQWAHVYFLVTPGKTAAGTRYLVGADIAIVWLDARLDESLRRSILIGFVSFTVVFLFSFYIGTLVSRKISRLAEYTHELASTDFAPVQDLQLRSEVERIPGQSRDEIAQLARSFIAMERRLNDYLAELTKTTAAKERLRNELKIAGEIQLSMLPSAFRSISRKSGGDRVDLHATLKPAKEAGGDLYDFFFLDDEHLFIAVGDVSDKGVPAALFMTVAITLLRGFATPELKHAPEVILSRTNDRLAEQNPMCQFITLFGGVLNVRSGHLLFANGGHNVPYRMRPGQKAKKIETASGIALGVMSEMTFDRGELDLLPGDTLFLYSDGITDALSVDETLFGEQRLEACLDQLNQRTGINAVDWVEGSLNAVIEFSEGHAQADDITILAVRMLDAAA